MSEATPADTIKVIVASNDAVHFKHAPPVANSFKDVAYMKLIEGDGSAATFNIPANKEQEVSDLVRRRGYVMDRAQNLDYRTTRNGMELDF